MGNGESIACFQDPWIPRKSLFRPLCLNLVFSQALVADFITESGAWNESLLIEAVGIDDIDIIRRIPIDLRKSDSFMWHCDKYGKYTVKSGYRLFMKNIIERASSSSNPMGKVWDIVWQLKVPSKVKFFCWKALRGFLPTRVNLHIRGMDIFTGCPMCSMAVESIDHCLFSCSKAKEIWRLTFCHDLLERDFNHWFEDRWIALCEILSRDELRLIAVTCWAIWGDKNN
ncbi:MAG: hypothetical protein Q8835_02880, partial [Sweet potato little leaf phytoplasma]|nr:hypothetical protein [Sweet potato little leaf phytoplasma]